MKTIFIYELIDPRTNEPKYIGKSINISNRLSAHLKDKAKTYKTNWIKGLLELNLKPIINVIDEVNEDEWSFWEQHYIDLYKSWGFKLTNLTPGGVGIKNFTSEVRKKMSLAKLGKVGELSNKKGKKHSKESCLKMSLIRKGKTYEEVLGVDKAKEVKEKQKKIRKGKTYEEIYGDRAEEIKEKQSKVIHPSRPAWNKGLENSKEVRLKIKEGVKDTMTEERKQHLSNAVLETLQKKKTKGFKFHNQKPVQQINKITGEVIKTWENCQDAERFFNNRKHKDNISDCARQNKLGKNRSCYGFKWLYLI